MENISFFCVGAQPFPWVLEHIIAYAPQYYKFGSDIFLQPNSSKEGFLCRLNTHKICSLSVGPVQRCGKPALGVALESLLVSLGVTSCLHRMATIFVFSVWAPHQFLFPEGEWGAVVNHESHLFLPGHDTSVPPFSPPSELLSKACKFTSSLVARAYNATGQATSTLHAMAILQEHQICTKSLRNLHEGGPDPDKMQELCKATDYALRTMKMMAQAVGQMTSTSVVQECHLWLNVRCRESELSWSSHIPR